MATDKNPHAIPVFRADFGGPTTPATGPAPTLDVQRAGARPQTGIIAPTVERGLPQATVGGSAPSGVPVADGRGGPPVNVAARSPLPGSPVPSSYARPPAMPLVDHLDLRVPRR